EGAVRHLTALHERTLPASRRVHPGGHPGGLLAARTVVGRAAGQARAGDRRAAAPARLAGAAVDAELLLVRPAPPRAADVVAEAQLGAVVEVGGEVGVVLGGAVDGTGGELAGHAQVDDEQAAVEVQHDPLAPAADGADGAAGELAGPGGRPSPPQRLGAGGDA